MLQNPYQIASIRIRSQVATWVSLGVSGLGLAGTLALPGDWKIASLGASTAVAIGAKVSAKNCSDCDRFWHDAQIAAQIQAQRDLISGGQYATAAAPELPGNSPQIFDFKRFETDPDRFPHVLVMGATGDGKSTLAEYLGNLNRAGKRYALATHRKPGDFAGFDGVYGGGRKYGKKDDRQVTWQEIANGRVEPTAQQFLLALFSEMDRRYKFRDAGEDSGDFLEIYLDEVPALAGNVPAWNKVIPGLIMEARKVKIRLWFLAQGELVELLGLKGRSDLRESLIYIRLGSFALNHADTLVREGKLPQEALEGLRRADRPGMVEDMLALVPDLSSYAKRPSEAPRKPPEVVQATVVPERTEKASSSQPEALESMFKPQPVQGINSKAFSEKEDLLNLALDCLDQGVSKDVIISEIWGYHGAEYELGLNLWKSMRLP